MDDQLTPIHTSKKPTIQKAQATSTRLPPSKASNVAAVEDVLEVLKSEPGHDQVRRLFQQLKLNKLQTRLVLPSPVASQIYFYLVSEVLPNYWSQFQDDTSEKDVLDGIRSTCRTIPGIGIILNRLKVLQSESKHRNKAEKKAFLQTHMTCLIGILDLVISPEDFVAAVFQELADSEASQSQKTLYWKEFASLIAGGRVVSQISEAETVLEESNNEYTRSWLGNGKEYAAWLAKNLADMAMQSNESDIVKLQSCCTLFSRTLSLGYPDIILEVFVQTLLQNSKDTFEVVKRIVQGLRPFEQRATLKSLLKLIGSRIRRSNVRPGSHLDVNVLMIHPVASFLRKFVAESDVLADYIVDIVSRSDEAVSISSVEVLYGTIIALTKDRLRIDTILQRAFDKFSDDVFTKHAPILHQETSAQVLLVVAGVHFNRGNRQKVISLSRAPPYMRAITDHLASNSLKVRWLGMIVGSAISRLVDKESLQMRFDDESLSTDEAKRYLLLTQMPDLSAIEFEMSELLGKPEGQEELKPLIQDRFLRPKTTSIASRPKKKTPTAATVASKNRIQVLDEDEDLIPYGKPDSDPEDEEEDPTLINRDKPKPPVYIRDLLVGLRETEDYDRAHIALTTAASLIRRKSGFGKEVKDHIIELATVLMNLNNNFEFEDFLEIRQEALIAVYLAEPIITGPLLASNAIEADFSIQQRSSIFAALGLGARELAGLKDRERSEIPSFPSKLLPEAMHNLYLEDKSSVLQKVSKRIEQGIVEPMALKAADEMSGPNALKVRTFSSRIEKAKTKKRPAANELAKIVGESLFFPLTGRWFVQSKAWGPRAHFDSTHLLSVFIRTLAIIMNASGPWALALPQMTAEFWTLLLSLRANALGNRHYATLEALFFGFLVLLEVNEDKERLAKEHPRELVETQQWAQRALGEIGAGDEEADRVRGLAASVAMRCQEVVERWQRLMVGSLLDY